MSAEHQDLIGDLIAEVARTHGIGISRDDPIVAVLLLNQLVLRRYLDESLGPILEAIAGATDQAVASVREIGQAQAQWLEQLSLKDRQDALEAHAALQEGWKDDIEELFAGQKKTLQRVVLQAAAAMKAQKSEGAQAPAPPAPSGPKWLLAGVALGVVSITLGLGMGLALAWGQ